MLLLILNFQANFFLVDLDYQFYYEILEHGENVDVVILACLLNMFYKRLNLHPKKKTKKKTCKNKKNTLNIYGGKICSQFNEIALSSFVLKTSFFIQKSWFFLKNSNENSKKTLSRNTIKRCALFFLFFLNEKNFKNILWLQVHVSSMFLTTIVKTQPL